MGRPGARTQRRRRRVLVVYGTRPEAIKLAPVAHALAATGWCRPVVAVTGQHRELLDQVNALFGIAPDHDLDLLRHGQSLAELTSRALAALTPLVEQVAPDALVVQGDTTTTFSAALAGFYRHVPVVHLEAGLRTDDPSTPFPEEMNRRLTTRLSRLHLAATDRAATKLLAEGVDPADVTVTGNTVIDALHWAVARPAPYGDARLEAVDASGRPVLLVTSHRRESWGEPMRRVGAALARLTDLEPDLEVVVPVHPNPVVRESLLPALAGRPNVTVVEPLGYGAFARLLCRATIALTDSGGVQEEAPAVGTPVLVLRDSTERPEAVAAGTARLVGTDPDVIVAAVRRLLHDGPAYRAMASAVSPYGDGRAAERAVAAIGALLGEGVRLPDFTPTALRSAVERVVQVV